MPDLPRVKGGPFTGVDYRNAGDGQRAVPGTGWLDRKPVPAPTEPPVPAPKPLSLYAAGQKQPTKMAVARLPLPVITARGLRMPQMKRASDWSKPFNAAAAVADDKELPIFNPARATPTQPKVPEPTAQVSENQPGYGSQAARLGTAVGVYAATRLGLNQGAKAVFGQGLGRNAVSGAKVLGLGGAAPTAAAAGGSRLGARLLGRLGGIGATAATGGATDLLDALGIYSMDGSKPFNAWQVPQLDENGEMKLDANGQPEWKVGFNPNGFGWKNFDQFNQSTTPDSQIMGWTPSNPYAAYWGSYGAAGLNASYQWPKSIGALGQTAYELPAMSRTARQHDVLKPWQPLHKPGDNAFTREAERWKQQDRYHPSYNPDGTVNRPWFGARWWDKLFS